MQRIDKFIIADDHPLFRAALHQTLTDRYPAAQIVEADSLAALQGLAPDHSDADLLLLDLNMPGAHGFSGLLHMRGQFPGLPVVIVSASEDTEVMHRCLACGALGFICKSADPQEIFTAIEQVLDGQTYLPAAAARQPPGVHAVDDDVALIATLTPHQFRVFTLLREGLLNKQIAYELGVSEATIKAHVTAILRKLGVNTRTQAVILADRLDLPLTERA